MTNKEVKQAEKQLREIEAMSLSGDKQVQALRDFFKTYGMHEIIMSGVTVNEWTNKMYDTAHIFLQTHIMINTCNLAKWSCIWAAVAATLSLFCALAAWVAVVVMVLIAVFAR